VQAQHCNNCFTDAFEIAQDLLNAGPVGQCESEAQAFAHLQDAVDNFIGPNKDGHHAGYSMMHNIIN